MDDHAPATGLLDELLIVGEELRRLGIAKLIDDRCPPDPRSVVSHGQCVEALISTILLGTHTLYQVSDTLEPYDLETAFGWPGVVAQHFHDGICLPGPRRRALRLRRERRDERVGVVGHAERLGVEADSPREREQGVHEVSDRKRSVTPGWTGVRCCGRDRSGPRGPWPMMSG